MDTISVLYHGSPKNLQQIAPQAAVCRLRDKIPLPPYVYAQPNLMIAHAYALKDKVRPSAIGVNPDTGICRMIVTSESTPWDQDLPRQEGKLGGFIYGLETKNFHEIRDRGEWVSELTQTPLSKKFITTEDGLLKGVQILVLSGQKGYRSENLWKVFGNGAVEEFLAVGLEKGAIRWLNKERGLNPVWPIDDDRRNVGSRPSRPSVSSRHNNTHSHPITG